MPKGYKGFQKQHPTFKGAEKGWFKKGQIGWNKELKVQTNTGKTHFKKRHPFFTGAEKYWFKKGKISFPERIMPSKLPSTGISCAQWTVELCIKFYFT